MKLLIAIAILLSVIFVRAEHERGNGGGLAEKNVLLAYANLEKYMSICAAPADVCKLKVLERAVLNKIIDGMTAEKKVFHQIQFVSENENPGFFMLDGAIRIAKTGSEVGSPVYINMDMIYETDRFTGDDRAISLPMAVAVLVHEFGHHHGYTDHWFLDQLGTKVQSQLLNERLTANMFFIDERRDKIEANLYSISPTDHTLIVNSLSDSVTVDLDPYLVSASKRCEGSVADRPPYVTSLSFGRVRDLFSTDRILLHVEATLRCRNLSKYFFKFTYELKYQMLFYNLTVMSPEPTVRVERY